MPSPVTFPNSLLVGRGRRKGAGRNRSGMSTVPPGATALPAIVQQAVMGISVGGEDANLALNTQTVSGNAIIACISYSSTAAISSIYTADTSDSLTKIVSKTVSGVITEIWIITNAAPNSGINVTSSGIGSFVINVSEWSGLKNAGAEATNSNSGVASSAVITNSVAPTSLHNVAIAVGAWTANDYSSGPTNSFTRMTPVVSGPFQESAYIIGPDTAIQSTGWTLSAGINWAAAIALFGGS